MAGHQIRQVLIDTNVLVYSVDPSSTRHDSCLNVVRQCLDGDVPAVLVPQVLLEFLSVITSPNGVPQPLDAPKAWGLIEHYIRHLPVLDIAAKPTLRHFAELIAQRPRSGSAIYDVFLIAQMRANDVGAICTVNARDFEGYGLTVLSPQEVASRPR